MKQRVVVWLCVLIMVVPGLALAVKKGRLIGKVLDPEGNPIPDVTVVATCEEVPSFKEVETTNSKGVFKLDFSHLKVQYQLIFSKTGFMTFKSVQDWDLEGTGRDEFTMFPGSTTVTEGPVASASSQAIYAFNQGVEFFNSQDYPAAEAKFIEALGHDPELQQAWAVLSRIHVKQEKWQLAVQAAEKAVALGSTNEEVWRARWEAYRNLGDEAKTAQALEDFKHAGLRAEEAKKIYNEGVALAKAGDKAGAFEKFKEALDVDANLMPALLGMATTGLEIDRNAEAANAAEAILNTEPNHEQALRIRYNAALKLGDDDMIIDSLAGLASVEPVVARDSLLRLAFEAYDANDLVNAKIRFLKVLEVDPNHALSCYLLGLICVSDGANDEAKTFLERFLQLAADHPEAESASELLRFLNAP
ncbi:MAG: tetratricopeptide repeat protein [Acidobacteriota bacterium]